MFVDVNSVGQSKKIEILSVSRRVISIYGAFVARRLMRDTSGLYKSGRPD